MNELAYYVDRYFAEKKRDKRHHADEECVQQPLPRKDRAK